MNKLQIAVAVSFLLVVGCSAFKTESDLQTRENQFRHQNSDYYRQLAQACDAVFAKAPPMERDTFCLVKPEKSTLPKIITDLHPKQLVVSRDGLSLAFSTNFSPDVFWIGWVRDETHTNVWNLTANIQGSNTVFCTETK